MNPLIRCAVALALLAAACGCGPRYDGLSPRAYEYAKALYAAANLQAADRLDPIATKIDADLAAGELTDREARWLLAVIAAAREGEWPSAARDARQMLADQVKH